MARFFFQRHGELGQGRDLSVDGINDIKRARTWLLERDFIATFALTSEDEACVTTARLLLSGQRPTLHPILFAFGNLKHVGVSIPYVGSKEEESGQGYATRALDTLLETAQMEENVVVVGHDEVPVLLAWRLIEMQGGRVDWTQNVPHRSFFPNRGEGLLVDGCEYEVFIL